MAQARRVREYISRSAGETRRIGQELARQLKPGDCIVLMGELGAGKTTLVQGIAQGLAIKDPIISPSFILIREYKGRIPLYHVDAYRVHNPEELLEVGLDDYVLSEGIVAIEWGDKIKKILPGCIEIRIEITSEGHRRIKIARNVRTMYNHVKRGLVCSSQLGSTAPPRGA